VSGHHEAPPDLHAVAAASVRRYAAERREDAIGWDVVACAVDATRGWPEGSMISGFAIGSLAHGGFVEAVSDVDVALVLDELSPAVADRMARVQAAVRERIAAPAASRLSIFWSTWDDLASGAARGRFPLADRVDLALAGRPLFGPDRRGEVLLPAGDARTAALVIEAATFAVEKLGAKERGAALRDPARLAAAGARDASKAVLFPARFLYTLDTGRVATNDASAEHYLARGGAATALVAAAIRWRTSGLGDEAAAAALLAAELGPLYAELSRDYDAVLRAAGRDDLAAALARFTAGLAR